MRYCWKCRRVEATYTVRIVKLVGILVNHYCRHCRSFLYSKLETPDKIKGGKS